MTINKKYTIGDLATNAGEEKHTLQFWLQEGLISPVEKTEGGYQLFDEVTIERIKKIRELQKSGFYTIKGIKNELDKEKK